jgi:glycolate oxidase FAD binding subunit
MDGAFRPDDAAGVIEAVRLAAEAGTPIELVGGGTKRGLGRPVQAERTLDLSGLTGILLYEPDELVMAARPGTPLAEIEATLAAAGQALAFEPPDLGPLLGAPAGRGTIGGAFACNLGGPRRFKAGAARDHLLGFSAVNGRAEAFKSGGRVVKNVTGYDLCKLLAGSWGTLAVLTEVTFKVLPAPELGRTLIFRGLAAAEANAAMTAALATTAEVSGAAFLPAPPAGLLPGGTASATLLRLEGVAPSVEARTRILVDALAGQGEPALLDGPASAALWAAVRDAAPLAGGDRVLWRLSLPPAAGAAVAGRLVGEGGDYLLDWGGGLLWLALPPSADADAERVHRAAAEAGGHAMLVRASEAVRAAVPLFPPQPPALAALEARVKESFDPRRIFNPGRLRPGH